MTLTFASSLDRRIRATPKGRSSTPPAIGGGTWRPSSRSVTGPTSGRAGSWRPS